ncbi:hypothetical protein [Bacillus toyonensis]|uniref:hypothetical protein n=1 Tax=Bacillus toyonensis TaxID=155322 RepID=UPI00159BB04B|nr:hypothetical protein [Bacillus toyonensis]
MLDKIMIEFIKVKQRITPIIDSKCNWIMTIKNNEVHVEREIGIEEELDLEFSVNEEETNNFGEI